MLILMDGPSGPGLYSMRFADPDPDEATFIAASLSEFLVGGVGPKIGT